MSCPHSSCGKPQETPVLLTKSRTTLLACLEELRNHIEQRHGTECVKAVHAFASADLTSTVAQGSSTCAPSATHVMMRPRDARKRASAANKVAPEAEQAKDAAEQEVEDLQHALGGKRARTEPST